MSDGMEKTREQQIIEYGTSGDAHCGALFGEVFSDMPNEDKQTPDMARAYIAGVLFRAFEALAMSELTADEMREYAEKAIALGIERANEFTAKLEKERGNLH